MNGPSHMLKVLLVVVFVLLFSIGEADWWKYVTIVCYAYYFAFAGNLFYRLYDSENVFTKFFFGYPELPVLIGIVLVVISIIVRKGSPDISLNSLYLCAFVGGFTTVVARIKSGRLQKR